MTSQAPLLIVLYQDGHAMERNRITHQTQECVIPHLRRKKNLRIAHSHIAYAGQRMLLIYKQSISPSFATAFPRTRIHAPLTKAAA